MQQLDTLEPQIACVVNIFSHAHCLWTTTPTLPALPDSALAWPGLKKRKSNAASHLLTVAPAAAKRRSSRCRAPGDRCATWRPGAALGLPSGAAQKALPGSVHPRSRCSTWRSAGALAGMAVGLNACIAFPWYQTRHPPCLGNMNSLMHRPFCRRSTWTHYPACLIIQDMLIVGLPATDVDNMGHLVQEQGVVGRGTCASSFPLGILCCC